MCKDHLILIRHSVGQFSFGEVNKDHSFGSMAKLWTNKIASLPVLIRKQGYECTSWTDVYLNIWMQIRIGLVQTGWEVARAIPPPLGLYGYLCTSGPRLHKNDNGWKPEHNKIRQPWVGARGRVHVSSVGERCLHSPVLHLERNNVPNPLPWMICFWR